MQISQKFGDSGKYFVPKNQFSSNPLKKIAMSRIKEIRKPQKQTYLADKD